MRKVKNLMYKELTLVLSPAYLVTLVLSAMTLVPGFLLIAGVSFFSMAIFLAFSEAKANNDMLFMMSLPIPRRHIVLSKAFILVVVEMIHLVVMVPLIIIANRLYPDFSRIGIEGNAAFFGIALICLAVFNLIFLPNFFKTGYKLGKPSLFATLGFWLAYGICELPVQLIPQIRRVVGTLDKQMIGWQLLILGVGLIAYALGLYMSYRASVQNFDKVDL